MRVNGKRSRAHGRTAAPQAPYDVVVTTTMHASEPAEDSATVIPNSIDNIVLSSRVTWEYYLA
jgi:hypothetical protein